jgi:hypothetical protein
VRVLGLQQSSGGIACFWRRRNIELSIFLNCALLLRKLLRPMLILLGALTARGAKPDDGKHDRMRSTAVRHMAQARRMHVPVAAIGY